MGEREGGGGVNKLRFNPDKTAVLVIGSQLVLGSGGNSILDGFALPWKDPQFGNTSGSSLAARQTGGHRGQKCILLVLAGVPIAALPG